MDEIMWNKFKYAMQRFAINHNCGDTLASCVLLAGALIMLIGSIAEIQWFFLIGWVFFVYYLFRFLSRNIPKRREENEKFCNFFIRLKKRWTDKEHRYFKCPQCRQTVRVPRGKGTIKIRCPKCGNQFEKKS